jgi:hypothetical protein
MLQKRRIENPKPTQPWEKMDLQLEDIGRGVVNVERKTRRKEDTQPITILSTRANFNIRTWIVMRPCTKQEKQCRWLDNSGFEEVMGLQELGAMNDNG